MPAPGPKPIPNELKQRTGTYRADRHGTGGMVRILPTEGTPEPPATLGQVGLQAWHRIFEHSPWIHGVLDYTAVQITCENLDELAQLRSHVADNPENWRDRASLRALEKQIIAMFALLGLTPSDRAKYGFAVVKAESSLEALMRRKREDEERQRAEQNRI
jgi:phage terminase small subunit